MEQRFDNLDMQAMTLADAELSNIASTQKLRDAETKRITELVLQKTGIANNTAHKGIRKQSCKKLGIILTAAVLTITAMGVSVSGYLRYNQPMVERNFGILGARRLEEMHLPDPVTYTNGVVDLTVEAVLCDGQYAMVLATLEAVDEKQKIDWEYEISLYEYIEDASEDVIGRFESFLLMETDHKVVDNQCWATWIFRINEGYSGSDAKLKFFKTTTYTPCDKDVPVNAATEGIVFPVSLVQNIPVLTLTSENGTTMYLSGYQLYASSMNAFTDFDFRLHRNDGSVSECVIPVYSSYGNESEEGKWASTDGKVYEIIAGKEFDQSDPSTYIGYLDLTDVAYIEFDGVNFYVQK